MRMSYYTIDGGRLAGLPGPAFMGWDFARLRKMGFGVVVSLECDRLNTFEIEDAGFEHKKICVEDFASPTFDQIDDFVAFSEAKLGKGRKSSCTATPAEAGPALCSPRSSSTAGCRPTRRSGRSGNGRATPMGP